MIRPAKVSESECLTRLSFASKRYWDYPEEFFEVWSDELTITEEYITNNHVFVHEIEDTVVGYYSIVDLKNDIEVSGIIIHKGFWLEHMFIEPTRIGQGIGRHLFRHLVKWCNELHITELGILADPNSKGFYEKMGCFYVGEYPSTIKNRTTPHLVFKF